MVRIDSADASLGVTLLSVLQTEFMGESRFIHVDINEQKFAFLSMIQTRGWIHWGYHSRKTEMRTDAAQSSCENKWKCVHSEMGERAIQIAPGRTLKVTAVFDTYWRFAAARQDLFMRRVAGGRPPWTEDPVLATHRFTNAYRAADRVSQYLIRHVLYEGEQKCEEIFFRALLFKFFNRIETWEEIEARVGDPAWKKFDFEGYARVLDAVLARGESVYSGAYIMPSPAFGNARKHRNHLRLVEHMMRDGAPKRVAGARSLREVFDVLRSYPSLGDFLAFQFTIDLNYSELIDFPEMEFVVAGPGARDGIRKCFSDTAGLNESDVIRAVTEHADREFDRLGLVFQKLWGRPLQLIDCQNLFCEVDKYARVVHPDVKGASGRTRIKQKFAANSAPLPQWYPPKWRIKVPAALAPTVSAPHGGRARQETLAFAPTAAR